METKNVMKQFLAIIFLMAVACAASAQTRSVIVNTSGVVQVPTNFWSADSVNARSGLGLGSASTNPSSAFQPSSLALSNISSGTALSVAQGGTGATNATSARSNLGLDSAATNPSSAFQPSSLELSNLSSGVILTFAQGGTGTTNAASLKEALGLAWPALTNSNSSTSLLGYYSSSNIVTPTVDNQLLFIDTIYFYPGNGYAKMWFNIFGSLYAGDSISDNGGRGSIILGTGIDDSGKNGVFFFHDSVADSRATPIGGSDSFNVVASGGTFIYGGDISINGTATISANTNGNGLAISYGTNGYLSIGSDGTIYFEDGGNFNIQPNGIARLSGVEFSSSVKSSSGYVAIGTAQGSLEWAAAKVALDVDGAAKFANGNLIISNNGSMYFTNAGTVRTNLGLPWSGLTNTNSTNFVSALFGSGTNPVLVNSSSTVVSPSDFWLKAPAYITMQSMESVVSNSTNNATNGRNVHIHSMAQSVIGVTNVVVFPTNINTINGDTITLINMGGTSSVTAARRAGESTNFITLSRYGESVRFIYEDSIWSYDHNISFTGPIYFADGSVETNTAITRTNLGLGWSAITNTNSTNFQSAVFKTNTPPTNSANVNTINFNTAVAWMEINVITNGTTNSYRIPLFQ